MVVYVYRETRIRRACKRSEQVYFANPNGLRDKVLFVLRLSY